MVVAMAVQQASPARTPKKATQRQPPIANNNIN